VILRGVLFVLVDDDHVPLSLTADNSAAVSLTPDVTVTVTVTVLATVYLLIQ